MTDSTAVAKARPEPMAMPSVQDRAGAGVANDRPMYIYLSGAADEIPPWWSPARDKAIDVFWPTEPMLAGAVYSMAAKVAAASWELIGPPRQVRRYQELLSYADFGAGWVPFIFKTMQDWLCSDNGFFWEIVRPRGMGAGAPPLGIAHLDSQRCQRTGDMETPVLYHSAVTGQRHKMGWWQAHFQADLPSPREAMFGVGLCAVSRVFRAAQILRNINLYTVQKLGGRRVPGIIFAQGVRRGVIEEALQEADESMDAEGLSHWSKVVVIASPDPAVPLDAKLIELAGLPDGFNYDELLRWYIAMLAIGFGTDYGEFAPLPGRSLGTATESLVQAEKAAGKGPGVAFQTLEYAVNWCILPPSVQFRFKETEPSRDASRASVMKTYAETLKILVETTVLTPPQAYELAVAYMGIPEDLLPPTWGETETGPESVQVSDTSAAEVDEAAGGGDEVLSEEQAKALTDRMEKAAAVLLPVTRQDGGDEEDDDSALPALLLLLWSQYEQDIDRLYQAWALQLGVDLADASPDDRPMLLDAAVGGLIIEMQRLGEDYFQKAYDAARQSQDGEPVDAAALAGFIASNDAYLRSSLGPDLLARLEEGIAEPDFDWTDVGVAAAAMSFAFRPRQYVDAIGAAFWLGRGVFLKGTAQDARPVRRLLDPSADHCRTCVPKAGQYESWDDMVSAVGLPGDGSDECGNHCRCRVEILVGNNWQQA